MLIVTMVYRTILIFYLSLHLFSPVMAEDITVLDRRAESRLILSVDGKEYIAIPTNQFRSLSEERKEALKKLIYAEEQIKQAQKELADQELMKTPLNEAVEANETLIVALKSVKTSYKSIANDFGDLSLKYKDLSTEYTTLLTDFSTLSDDYKKLGEQYRGLVTGKVGLRLSLGVGMRSDSEVDEVKPAFLVGAGYRWIRLWGTFDEHSTGVLAGVEIPVF